MARLASSSVSTTMSCNALPSATSIAPVCSFLTEITVFTVPITPRKIPLPASLITDFTEWLNPSIFFCRSDSIAIRRRFASVSRRAVSALVFFSSKAFALISRSFLYPSSEFLQSFITSSAALSASSSSAISFKRRSRSFLIVSAASAMLLRRAPISAAEERAVTVPTSFSDSAAEISDSFFIPLSISFEMSSLLSKSALKSVSKAAISASSLAASFSFISLASSYFLISSSAAAPEFSIFAISTVIFWADSRLCSTELCSSAISPFILVMFSSSEARFARNCSILSVIFAESAELFSISSAIAPN